MNGRVQEHLRQAKRNAPTLIHLITDSATRGWTSDRSGSWRREAATRAPALIRRRWSLASHSTRGSSPLSLTFSNKDNITDNAVEACMPSTAVGPRDRTSQVQLSSSPRNDYATPRYDYPTPGPRRPLPHCVPFSSRKRGLAGSRERESLCHHWVTRVPRACYDTGQRPLRAATVNWPPRCGC